MNTPGILRTPLEEAAWLAQLDQPTPRIEVERAELLAALEREAQMPIFDWAERGGVKIR